ncbi:XRE family transcriptional regulator [Streptomyces sp. H27-C3]|uniref:XRE family transcriptional regulator n=1 Tax=Streptomyces sp. H27-C3 TaxID=3046305 RepID=UPI0024B88973|nr:XRE family transcriptional regulator [Streptomyces sp. H27-C3]MDJ0465040.1 XRE family transcriptional regulator [Streptomyces sp. H27-C3]
MREVAAGSRLPSQVLDDPRMVEACRVRDFGAIFMLVRRAGIYPSRIARLCEMTPSRVSEVIAGKRTLNQIGVIERVADGLGIPGNMLGLAARTWESSTDPAAQDLAAAGETQCRVIPPPSQQIVVPADDGGDEALELKRELLAATSADSTVASLYSTQVDTMRKLDRQLGAERLLPQLQEQILQMENLLRYGTAAGAREALAGALTEAATLAGWQALDLGRYKVAWSLHETAKSAAREAGSPALLAHATAQQAYVLLDLGEPADAVKQIRFAREQGGRAMPPLMESWLYAAEAEAHAAAQNEVACRLGLERAEAVRPADPSDPTLPFLFLAGSHLDRWRGNCLATLGADEGLEDLTAALSSMDMSGFTRAEAGVRCDLAVVLARKGEFAEAQKQAVRAQDLAALTSSVRQRRRIAQVLSSTAV